MAIKYNWNINPQDSAMLSEIPMSVPLIVYILNAKVLVMSHLFAGRCLPSDQSRNDQAVCVLVVLHERSWKYSIQARATFPVLRKVTERRASEGMRSLRNGRRRGRDGRA